MRRRCARRAQYCARSRVLPWSASISDCTAAGWRASAIWYFATKGSRSQPCTRSPWAAQWYSHAPPPKKGETSVVQSGGSKATRASRSHVLLPMYFTNPERILFSGQRALATPFQPPPPCSRRPRARGGPLLEEAPPPPPGSWELAARSWDLGAGTWELAAGSWDLGPGSWQLGPGSWQLGPGSWELGPRSLLRPTKISKLPAATP